VTLKKKSFIRLLLVPLKRRLSATRRSCRFNSKKEKKKSKSVKRLLLVPLKRRMDATRRSAGATCKKKIRMPVGPADNTLRGCC
jgi:hypothetical protein